MSHVQVMYLSGVGQYRQRLAKLTAVWPKLLLNDPDKMAHSLVGRPTIPKVPPVRSIESEQANSIKMPDLRPSPLGVIGVSRLSLRRILVAWVNLGKIGKKGGSKTAVLLGTKPRLVGTVN